MRGLPIELLDLQYKIFENNDIETMSALKKLFSKQNGADESVYLPLLFMNKLSSEEYVSYIKNILLQKFYANSGLQGA
jgi:hypothetical protein